MNDWYCIRRRGNGIWGLQPFRCESMIQETIFKSLKSIHEFVGGHYGEGSGIGACCLRR